MRTVQPLWDWIVKRTGAICYIEQYCIDIFAAAPYKLGKGKCLYS
jgi:hypothetical protein